MKQLPCLYSLALANKFKCQIKDCFYDDGTFHAIVDFDNDASLFDAIGLENFLEETFDIQVDVTSYQAYKKGLADGSII